MMIILETCISVNNNKKVLVELCCTYCGCCFFVFVSILFLYFWLLFFVPFFHILQTLPVLQMYCWVFSQLFQKQMRKQCTEDIIYQFTLSRVPFLSICALWNFSTDYRYWVKLLKLYTHLYPHNLKRKKQTNKQIFWQITRVCDGNVVHRLPMVVQPQLMN